MPMISIETPGKKQSGFQIEVTDVMETAYDENGNETSKGRRRRMTKGSEVLLDVYFAKRKAFHVPPREAIAALMDVCDAALISGDSTVSTMNQDNNAYNVYSFKLFGFTILTVHRKKVKV